MHPFSQAKIVMHLHTQCLQAQSSAKAKYGACKHPFILQPWTQQSASGMHVVYRDDCTGSQFLSIGHLICEHEGFFIWCLTRHHSAWCRFLSYPWPGACHTFTPVCSLRVTFRSSPARLSYGGALRHLSAYSLLSTQVQHEEHPCRQGTWCSTLLQGDFMVPPMFLFWFGRGHALSLALSQMHICLGH